MVSANGGGDGAPDVAGLDICQIAGRGPLATPRPGSPRWDIQGVLDTSFERAPSVQGKVPTGYGFWCNAWPENPGWKLLPSASDTT
jgi:hypothetical protein